MLFKFCFGHCDCKISKIAAITNRKRPVVYLLFDDFRLLLSKKITSSISYNNLPKFIYKYIWK